MVSRKVTILGAGESGTGAALLARSKGYDVFVSDFGKIKDSYKKELTDAGIAFEEGKHSVDIIFESSLIIKSPGISEKSDIIKKAQAKNIQFIDEIEFAAQYTTAKIIAITGTNGKTTTTLLTYHLLKEAGLNVGLAGNVGHSLAKQIIEDKHDYYVVEMSSFQLDGAVYFKPFIGVLLNITPDHMDRYDYKLTNYVDSKFRLVSNMTPDDHFIYYADNVLIQEAINKRSIKAQLHAVSLTDEGQTHAANGEIIFDDGFKIAQQDTVLRGEHNAINMMAAISAARILKVDEECIRQSLKTFKNAPHRMEYVATINDVDFINDSKATNVDAVRYALDSFTVPLVWIAGGIDKGNDYSLVMESVNAKVKALVCLGKDNSKLRDAFHEQIINLLETDNIKDAVRSALGYAEAHDVVLLSPACASFDLFKNYEDRGNQFKQAVLELKQEFESKALNQ
ncbi:UDP-N-acetylmuramoyl-L-alanine--D-glutamate ligase [Fulvivirga ulvae]|uniref:UDP-N-acetylmuramoyl-L-alanine--D-glutamate ligase n=1 Tax=Fulvivirga ulvae TaxID=2904245 RepID=UPI001F4181DC|nr:UDP-N-acetylmuramoyl-L-alanine--D-glutamate ligase [Fulvivirga ulvae]UII32659.1 UDP-N-acetylmuramoyl-L-alanine--D-glutamate ligase [Fulvivirga ulvae]